MVTATVIGDEALAAKFAAAAAALEAEKPYWIHDVGLIVQESILEVIDQEGLYSMDEDNPPHPHLASTGRLFNQTKNGISVGYGKDHPAAQALEHGARPHVIYAKDPTQQMLSFYWEREGRWFYGPAVYHPGNRPYKFMYRGTLAAVTPICFFFMEKLRGIFGVGL